MRPAQLGAAGSFEEQEPFDRPTGASDRWREAKLAARRDQVARAAAAQPESCRSTARRAWSAWSAAAGPPTRSPPPTGKPRQARPPRPPGPGGG